MQITGMLHGSRLLQFVGFPSSEVLGPGASEEEIKSLIDRHGQIFIKPVFKGGVGKKGKAGLLGRAHGSQDGARRKGTTVLRRTRRRPCESQGERRDVRSGRAGQA